MWLHMKNISILGSGKSIEREHVVPSRPWRPQTISCFFLTVKTYKASCRSLVWGVEVIFSGSKTPSLLWFFLENHITQLHIHIMLLHLVCSSSYTEEEKTKKAWQAFPRPFHVIRGYQAQLNSGSWLSSTLKNKTNVFNSMLCLYRS